MQKRRRIVTRNLCDGRTDLCYVDKPSDGPRARKSILRCVGTFKRISWLVYGEVRNMTIRIQPNNAAISGSSRSLTELEARLWWTASIVLMLVLCSMVISAVSLCNRRTGSLFGPRMLLDSIDISHGKRNS